MIPWAKGSLSVLEKNFILVLWFLPEDETHIWFEGMIGYRKKARGERQTSVLQVNF